MTTKIKELFARPLPACSSARQYVLFVLLFLSVVVGQTFIFSLSHKTSDLLVPLSVLPGVLLGSAIWWLERLLASLKQKMIRNLSVSLVGFLLFFAHLIGYFLLSVLLVSYPLGWLLERIWSEAGMAREYGLLFANTMLLMAFISWLINVRTVFAR